jgi:quinohemoprotein ethanol dehydrogenase
MRTMAGAIAAAYALVTCAATAAQDWISVHGDTYNHRYVPLDQINPKTISRLGAVWVSEPFAEGATSRMTPLVHDGLMFFGAGARIYALDARSGRTVWVHQTETRKAEARPKGADFDFESMISEMATTRAWGLGMGGGMIFVGLMNGHVAALRERTGDLVWDRLISNEPLAISKGITSPPLYVDGVLYFGLGQETTEGRAAAVEAKSGKLLWRVATVAEPGQPGGETWPQGSGIWRSGGAHPWVAGAADPSLGLVYYGTGNAGPAYGGKVRPGDNLYSVSLIALEMKTGKLRWHQQLIHHDVWEADLSVSPVLFDRKTGARTRRGVAIMRGDGYLFLFDREKGEPLVPVDESAVPQNAAVYTAPTQPFPRGADSILPPCESWKSKIPEGFALGCMFDPPSHDAPNRLSQYASVRLAPMSFSPRTGYFYAQGTNSLMWLGTGDNPYDTITNVNGARVPNFPRPTVVVAAIDGRTDKVVWRTELPSFDDSGYKSNGGALSTAGGLVFHQGGDGTLQAYDDETGQTRWKFQTDFAVGDAAPMSYAVDGKQYVAFIAGSKVWAFALGGRIAPAKPISEPPLEEIRGPIQDTTQIETFSYEHEPANGLRYRMNEYAFNPYRARVRVGTPVIFINNGYLPHTITARDGSWSTGRLTPTEVSTITYDQPGNYLYTSEEYPWSYGELIVTAADAGVLTDAQQAASDQVDTGKRVYAASCASCHSDDLSGSDRGTALVGPSFIAAWRARDALALLQRIRTTMPATAPGTLSDDQYAAIVAYLLRANGNAASVTLDPRTMKGLTISRP